MKRLIGLGMFAIAVSIILTGISFSVFAQIKSGGEERSSAYTPIQLQVSPSSAGSLNPSDPNIETSGTLVTKNSSGLSIETPGSETFITKNENSTTITTKTGIVEQNIIAPNTIGVGESKSSIEVKTPGIIVTKNSSGVSIGTQGTNP